MTIAVISGIWNQNDEKQWLPSSIDQVPPSRCQKREKINEKIKGMEQRRRKSKRERVCIRRKDGRNEGRNERYRGFYRERPPIAVEFLWW